jgi:hypothetical protein
VQRLMAAGACGKQGPVLGLMPQSVLNRQARFTHARRAVNDEGTPWVLLEMLLQFRQDAPAPLEQAAQRAIGQVPWLRRAHLQPETIAKY